MTTEILKKYSVRSEITGNVHEVEAADESEAVRKAQETATGREAGGPVTWHGMHAEVGGCGRWRRPVEIV